MSAFEVNVTPTRGSQPKRRTESREPTLVVLGPFTPKATVIFEGVPIGKTACRQLVVQNPYNEEIKVLVTKIPKIEFNLGLEWTSCDIPAREERQLELVWNPMKLFASKEVLQMSDSCGNKKDIALILKSTELKKVPVKKPVLKQAPLLPKKLKLKSPSPPKAGLKRNLGSKKWASPLKKSFASPPAPVVRPPIPKVNVLGPTNVSNIFSSSAFNFSHVSESAQLNPRANKENVSPVTPENASKLFNSIKFTPSDKNDLSYLADLPTPVNYMKVDDIRLDKPNLLRKRLSISPEIDLFYEFTPRMSTNQSILAMKETPKSCFNTDDKTVTSRNPQLSLTPPNHVTSKTFDPNCFSTITKSAQKEQTYLMIDEMQKNSGKQLDFSHELELADIPLKDSPMYASLKAEAARTENVSPCNEIQLVFLNNLEAAFSEQPKVLNKTQTVSPYASNPQLSMIAEENSRELGLTYHAGRVSEELISHQKTFKIINHDSMAKSNSDDDIVKNLTMEIKLQGSMPNLNDRDDEDDGETRMFMAHEIRAQSSRFNLHEISRTSDEMKPAGTGIGAKRYLDNSLTAMDSDEPVSMAISPPKRSKLMTTPSLTSLQKASSGGSGRSSSAGPPLSRSRSGNSSTKSCFQVPKATAPRSLSLKRAPGPIGSSKKLPLEEKRIFLYDSEQHLKTLINPDPFAATTTCDPFLTATMYLDERAFEKHERQLKKWLNALVTIPADLDTEPNKPLDVGKLFDEVKCKELTLAPTKELISSNYYKNRLNQLRSTGISLYLSEKVAEPLRKARSAIEKKSMTLRTDRDLHLDLVLQRNVLELLLCFNPLWLRLGLEVTFGEQIDLQSNRDVIGLSTFIINRLFRDRYMEMKNSKAYSLSPTYADHMKKFTFRMFLFLLFFLDTAKNQRLIKHNPCLFVKNAPYKETREILIRFSSHLIAGIGDITKHLKRFGYVLTHKQTYLDEFDYAFENLAVDLRDGIRLTRVMEIILLRDDLTLSLRVPSISRLQKVHNVNLALKALEDADYQITGDITAKDICDGHREKTLSLLWQIVYKFRAPKFNAAANVIRNWWKRNWMKVVIARRIEEKRRKKMELAAVKIQARYRAFRTRQCFRRMRETKQKAVVILQKYTRRYLAQKHTAQRYSSILRIQRWWRSVQLMKSAREHFLQQRHSAILIQTTFRRHLLARRLLAASVVIGEIKTLARLHHQKALVLQRALKSYTIHRKLQSIVIGMVAFNRRKAIKYQCAARIQATVRMWKERRQFLMIKEATVRIQLRWKECLLARRQREKFLEMRTSAIVIQQRVRGYFLMKETKTVYERERRSIIFVQNKFRAKLGMRRARKEYLQLKHAAVSVQRRFRALVAMRKQRSEYLQLKLATLVIQQRLRAQNAMRLERRRFVAMRASAIIVQRKFRALVAMRVAHDRYQLMRSSCITIQRRLRATILMKQQRIEFLTLQYHAIIVQQQFRANLLSRSQRQKYLNLKSAAICVQRKVRATNLARRMQRSYREQRQAAINIQRYWRAVQLKRKTRKDYLQKRLAAVTIQRCYRGHLLTTQIRQDFVSIRAAAIRVQQQYRAIKLMQTQRQNYEKMIHAAVALQRRYRAKQLGQQQKTEYVELKEATICVQRRWRAVLAMKTARAEYLTIRKSTIVIQNRFRGLQLMRSTRAEYVHTRTAIILIQRQYRAKRKMERACGQYLNMKSATIVIQQYFRGYLEMKRQKASFTELRSATLCLQARFRALRQMKLQKTLYLKQRTSAICIQRYFRGYLAMSHQRREFLQMKQACVVLQSRYRARLATLDARHKFETLRSATVTIQRRWRATLAMREQRSTYQAILQASLTIQIRYRAYKLRLFDQLNYRVYRSAIIVVQRRFRAKLITRVEQKRFHQLKVTTLHLQTRARGYLARQAFLQKLTPEYLERRKREQAAKRIQACWRGYQHRKRHQTVTMRDIALRMIASRREAARDPSKRLSNILRSCMKFMKTRFAVHEAIKVLLRIEQISRLLPRLLQNDAIFLATFCYGTMAQAIRSELDKQLIEICARIILNLARFEGTKQDAFQENGLVTVSQMLLRWCDKDCGIFNTLCTLLWIISHDTHKRNAIRRYMISREAIFMLRETKKLVKRKENMRKNVKKPVGCLAPPDPTLMSMEPALDPDYGVIRSKPYVFYSSVFAFDTVLNVLSVDIS
ncbi:protein abnormal spindle [Ochlerotatus camptorhynchus]|uniref:protein abnormal spindle n=1 Tax=Ochlerotatus camptorhynchus TaxID=644619 RepID=UPI0031D762A4